MRWPRFVSGRRHDAEVGAVRADLHRVMAERDDARADAASWKTAAVSAAEKFTDTSIVNDCLTEDLTAAREQLAERDAYRETLAGALGADLDLTWDQVVAAAERTHQTAADRQADYEAEKARADQAHADSADADRQAIEAWEQRVKDHTAWEPGTVRLVAGGVPRPTHPAVVLRHALSRCHGLEARLAVAEGRRRGVGS